MPPSLLVVHPGALGDVVLAFGLLRELRRRFTPVALMAQSGPARLAVEEGLADEAFALESAWTASLFGGKPDSRVRDRLSPYSHALSFSQAPGLAAGLRATAREGVYTVAPRPAADLRLHAAEHAWAEAVACGLLPPGAAPPAPSPRAAAPEKDAAVLIHPGAGSPRKRWPIERFRAVAAAVESEGGRVEYVLGPADEELSPHLADAVVHRPADTLALRRLLIAAAASVGNDSGVSHLAAWLGVPCVAVFGPSDPERWRPVGARVAVVRPPLSCAPCFETAPVNCAQPDCLLQISPAEVLRALKRVTGGTTA
ncbi:MAG TPA: glycosyltransferase family 9 protein, partial [Desulfobacterales bacterium]|nr:glycosyltransferase family 9 protein [Desulfobacterales bacterium]